ncbi:MAG: protein kinase [Planctomycetes bacterium]|nr:protein kinase [Planctomycetota bacterium]
MPERLGHYLLLRKIGEGGMGVVHLARDERLNREVALKILPPELALRSDGPARFRREAETLSRLDHPAIVTIHEFGEDRGLAYFVMPHIEGISLREWVRLLERRRQAAAKPEGSGPITTGRPAEAGEGDLRPTDPGRDLARILDVFATAAAALDHAHRQGIVHRDVKPSNILIDRDGQPHLLDFGLAKVVGEATLGGEGNLMGTLPYMAPEQVAESSLPVDGRSDVYALGVSLFECLCGRRPFQAETPDALALQILMKQPPSPRLYLPDIGRDLETIVLKCLEKDPGRRYRSAALLAQDLRRFREHRDIVARPVGRLGRVLRWAEAHRALAATLLVATVLVIVLGGLLIGHWFSTRAEHRRMEIYHRHVARARELEQRRDEARERLRLQEQQLERLDRDLPRHLPPESAGKQELFRARAERRRLAGEIARLQAAMEYELQLSREAVEPIHVEGAERAAMLRTIHAEALKRGDQVTAERMAFYLREAGIDPDLALEGRLSIRSEPAGALVTAYPVREGIDGIRRAEVAAGRDLGSTPLVGQDLPVGLWEIVLRLDGRAELRFPVLIEHDEHWGDPSWHGGLFADRDWSLRLLARDAVDAERWCRVAAGPFQAALDGGESLEPETEWRWLDDFLIARRETTFGDYEPFLARSEILAETMKLVREENRLIWLPRLYDWLGIFSLRSDGRLGDGEAVADQPARPYSPDFALAGLSFRELEAYAAWRAERDGAPIHLPGTDQWQKAARGVDARLYPWGDQFDWAFLSGRYSVEGKGEASWEFHPRRPGSFPIDESPYGALDMAGNAAEWCADAPRGDGFGDQRWVLGGSFGWSLPSLFVSWPVRSYPFDHYDLQFGLRLARELPR